jgi:hypothetical protein
MLIFGEQYSGSKFVQIHGTADIIEQPEPMDLLIYCYRQAHEHKNWDEYRQRMENEKGLSFAAISKNAARRASMESKMRRKN